MGRVMVEDEPAPEDIDELIKLRIELITSNKPHNFKPTDTNNVLVAYDKSFADLLSLAEQNGTPSPGAICPFDFYARIDFLRRKFSPQKNK